MRISPNTPAVSHLLHADDLLLTCRASDQEAAFVMESLKRYYYCSGQEVNTDKSSIMFSKSNSRRMIKDIKKVTGLKSLRK